MYTRMLVGLFLTSLLAGGCASTTARVAPATPDDDVAESPDAGPTQSEPAQPDAAAAPSDDPGSSSTNFAYPEGWTVRHIPERSAVLLTDPSGAATITFGILSPERGTGYDQIEGAWTSLSESVSMGNPIEVGELSSLTFDGVEAHYFIARARAEDGTPLTQIWVTFASNRPGLDIMVIGTWPQSQDEMMMEALRMVTQSIRIGEPSPGQPVPPEGE